MQTHKALLLTFFTLFYFSGLSQNLAPSIISYTTRDYGKEYNPEIFCSAQDNRGVMYFGTGNGVLEFDGEYWKHIKVQAGSYVRAICSDTLGRIYVGTLGDFGYLAPNELGKTEFVSLLSKVKEADLFFSEIWGVHANNSKVFFQAQEQVFEYDIKTEKIKVTYPTETSSFHTSFMLNNELYLRAREIGVVKYVDGDLNRLRGTENVRGLGVFGVHQLPDDSLLIVTQEIGLWKWKNNGFVQLPDVNEVPLVNLGIFGSIHLQDGNLAVWTFTDGVYILNNRGKILHHVDKSNGLISNDVKNLFQDKDQNIWACTGNGMSKIDYYSPLSFYTSLHGLEGSVQAIKRFNGKLYVGTSNGLFIQNTSEGKAFINTSQFNTQVWGFEQVADELFVASSQGIYSSTTGDNFKQRTSFLESSNKLIYVPEKHYFVSGGPFGISVYDSNFEQVYFYDEQISSVLGIDQDPNNKNLVWVGTAANGVFKVDLSKERVVVTQYGDFDGILDNLGKPLINHDSLIFGTKEGLAYFISEEKMKAQLSKEEQEDPDNYKGMFQTEAFHGQSLDGQFLFLKTSEERDWFSEDNYSIAYFDNEAKTFVYKPFRGIDFGRINEFYLEADGVFWVGTVDGLIRFESNEIKSFDTPVTTLIRKVRVGVDSTVFYGAFSEGNHTLTYQNEDDLLELSYNYNDIYFAFSSTSFQDKLETEYSFLLEGYNENWSNWNAKTEANFTNLSEGDYFFKVKSRNVYGTESIETVFKFKILPPWYRTIWAYLLYGLILVLVFIVVYKLLSARLVRQNLWLEGVVEERTREISEKNEVLKEQKKEIEDSINYAQRIQEAILPLEENMKKWVPKSFVLFRPKDIVSGDFYWFTAVDNKLVLICADCTGHGVPGAFMSMIGSDRLNIIIEERKVLNPGLILAELSRSIKKSLKQDGQKESTKDGMDAAICTIDLDTNELRYAGANRPLWIIKDDKIEEISATKVAVAGFTPDDQIFEEHVIKLTKDLKFYMTTDGYADQFGGVKGKKLKVKTLKELILRICHQEYEVQKNTLDRSLFDWMGDHEQIDDVCVMGFEPGLGPDK